MKITPYGIDQCAICDSDDPAFLIPTEDGELIAYCADHAREIKNEFPDSQLFSLPAKVTT